MKRRQDEIESKGTTPNGERRKTARNSREEVDEEEGGFGGGDDLKVLERRAQPREGSDEGWEIGSGALESVGGCYGEFRCEEMEELEEDGRGERVAGGLSDGAKIREEGEELG